MPDPSALPPPVVSVAEAARRLYGIHPRDVLALADEGLLRTVAHGARLGIDEESIDSLLSDYEAAYGAAIVQAWFDDEAEDDPLGPELDDAEVYVRDREEGIALAAASARRHPRGAHLFVGLDRARQVRLFLPMEPSTPLAQTVAMLGELFLPGEALLIVSNRTGEVPADRPDDELVWEEMLGAARSRRVVLLDWWILWGQKLFSAAEFSPSGPGWTQDAEGLPGRAS